MVTYNIIWPDNFDLIHRSYIEHIISQFIDFCYGYDVPAQDVADKVDDILSDLDLPHTVIVEEDDI